MPSFEVAQPSLLWTTWKPVNSASVERVEPGVFRVGALAANTEYTVRVLVRPAGGETVTSPASAVMRTLTESEDKLKRQREFYDQYRHRVTPMLAAYNQ